MKRFSVASAALFAAIVVCQVFAHSPTQRPRPGPHVNSEVYGVASDGTQLRWIVYKPSGTGPWPAVVIIHGGGFHTGSPRECAAAGQDLAAVGFVAFAIYYRLDLDKLPGQTSTGQWAQQTDNAKMAVRAARKNSLCNGKVGVLGGSAGGTHGASVAIEHETSSLWTPGDRVNAAVLLSGAYDFSDREPSSHLPQQINDFNRYTGTTDLARQLSMSPVSFVDSGASPMLLVRSQSDPMPPGHQSAMLAKLAAVGARNYQSLTVPGSAHSFANWPAAKARAIAFFRTYLSGAPTPTPSASPTATQTPAPSTAIYPKGVWASMGAGATVPPSLAANKGIVGVIVTTDWDKIETSDGVYGWAETDAKIASAKAAGFKYFALGITDSTFNCPIWLRDELKAAGQTITFHSGQTYTFYRVPEHIYHGLVSATSPGGYYHAYICGRYRP